MFNAHVGRDSSMSWKGEGERRGRKGKEKLRVSPGFLPECSEQGWCHSSQMRDAGKTNVGSVGRMETKGLTGGRGWVWGWRDAVEYLEDILPPSVLHSNSPIPGRICLAVQLNS